MPSKWMWPSLAEWSAYGLLVGFIDMESQAASNN